MRYIYYIDGKKFTTYDFWNIPWDVISFPNENTPAYEDTLTDEKSWFKERSFHRLTGPAYISPEGNKYFYLNGVSYETIKEWISDHPNPDLYFDALGMNETDKILWFLQN
jgi:hypothetical protein